MNECDAHLQILLPPCDKEKQESTAKAAFYAILGEESMKIPMCVFMHFTRSDNK